MPASLYPITHLPHLVPQPSIDDYPFAGWIPTISGALSFRKIGPSAHLEESEFANFRTSLKSKKSSRFILAYQRRYLSDSYMSKTLEKIFSLDGHFHLSAYATSSSKTGQNTDTSISGEIFLSVSNCDTPPRHMTITKNTISRINKAEDDSLELPKNDVIRTSKILHKKADVYFNFKLFRNGDFFISQPYFNNQHLKETTELRAKDIHTEANRRLADQAYFFIRDITHKHQHHENEEDLLIVLQERSELNINSWRVGVIHALYQNVTRAKRRMTHEGYNKALGILGYAKSFKKICKVHPEGPLDHELSFNDDEIAQSLGSATQDIARIQTEKNATLVKRTLYIALAGIIISYLLQVTSIIDIKIILEGITNIIKINPRHNLVTVSATFAVPIALVFYATGFMQYLPKKVHNFFLPLLFMSFSTIERYIGLVWGYTPNFIKRSIPKQAIKYLTRLYIRLKRSDKQSTQEDPSTKQNRLNSTKKRTNKISAVVAMACILSITIYAMYLIIKLLDSEITYLLDGGIIWSYPTSSTLAFLH